MAKEPQWRRGCGQRDRHADYDPDRSTDHGAGDGRYRSIRIDSPDPIGVQDYSNRDR